MDNNTLRVFNLLHNLRITEEEFGDIQEEQKHKQRTGLYIAAVKKGACICVSHDQNHKIVIKEIIPQHTDINKNNIEHGEVHPQNRILFKTLIAFSDIPQEIYTLHQTAQYRALDTEIKHIAHNLEELKDRICDRFADDYPKELGGMYEDVYADSSHKKKNKNLRLKLVNKQLQAIYWLFGEKYEEKDIFSRLNVPRIIRVFSRNNRRIAIIQDKQKWNREIGDCFHRYEHIDRTILKIRVFMPKDREYNYVCPGRELLRVEKEGKAEIWLDDDLFEKVSSPELCILSNITKQDWLLLNADKFNKQKREIRVELMNARREEVEKEAKKILENNIQKQFENGSVVRHGIEFTKKSISYEGIKIEGNGMDRYLVSQNIILQEMPGFNEIFEGYIEYILRIRTDYDCYPYQRTKPEPKTCISIKTGKIRITIKPIKRCILINGFRICKEDVESVLKKAINYKTQAEYDEFLQYTGKVNLRLQKALKEGGIRFELQLDRTDDCCLSLKDDKMILAIPVIRKDEKNYVLIKGKEYRIMNIKSLFALADERYINHYEGYLQKTIKQLYKAISKISAQDIGHLISNGRKEYRKMMARLRKEEKARLARSREFLEHAVKITKAIRVDKGYFVDGISGTTYYVSDDMGVWTIKDGKQDKYLCIVDIGSNPDDRAGKNDCIAKRLLMLSKDRKVADEIYSRGDQMDKHWLEIRGEKGVFAC